MAVEIPLCFPLNYDEWIFQALSTIDENNHGNGWDIDEIANYITERHKVAADFIQQLKIELRYLECEGELELNVQNEEPDRYKIRYNNTLFHSKEPEVSLVPEVALGSINATETMTISEDYQRPQDKPSTSSSSVPTESEKRAQLEEIVDAVVHTEHYELRAKEAYDAYFNNMVWAYENLISLFVARRIVIHCANGHKVYMRKSVSPGPVQ